MQLNPVLLWSLGELLLISLIAVLALILRGILRRRRDRVAAQSLIQQIKDDEERRNGETRDILEQRFGINGNTLDDLVKAISREEKRFYQTLINLYLKRDARSLENLNVTFEGAVGPYRSLELPQAENPGTPSGDVVTDTALDDAELERLRNENESLSEELRITMDTMGRMLSEYSSMFSGGDDEALDKEKMIAMFQAGQGTADGASAEPAEDSNAESEGKREEAGGGDQASVKMDDAEDPRAGSSAEDAVPDLQQEPDTEAVTTDAENEDELMSLDDDLESLQTAETPPVGQVQV